MNPDFHVSVAEVSNQMECTTRPVTAVTHQTLAASAGVAASVAPVITSMTDWNHGGQKGEDE